MNTLPAGKYWIGDLCYVLGNDDSKFNWQKFCDFSFKDDKSGRKNEGIVTNQKITFAYFGTAYGDGCYNDQYGNEYGVDAGIIGCIPIASIVDKEGWRFGHVHEFSEPFTVSYSEYDKGIIRFGHISIPTDGCDEDEYEDRYDNTLVPVDKDAEVMAKVINKLKILSQDLNKKGLYQVSSNINQIINEYKRF